MKTLKITIVGVLGLIGFVLFCNDGYQSMLDLLGILSFVCAFLLYRKWRGELDEDEYI